MTGAVIIKAPPPHALADLPPMEGREFDELVGDIQRRGLRIPLVIFEGKGASGSTIRSAHSGQLAKGWRTPSQKCEPMLGSR